ncbi:hypothetical protein Syun_013385 [Stephania yunnanensis]|uniref:RING-type E3 ubiquitin transferase n=1 Tax=Stephania yunnanensis TaxID=152371 RepID=A0AAP0K3E8_9MAGN
MPKEEMHSVFITSSLFLAILLAVTTKGEDHFDDASAETRCGDDGPPIRFPFSLIKLQQEDHHHPNVTSNSGYPGFELSCTDQNHTLLQLPHGGKFWVTRIDYASQELIVSDPDGCIVPRLLHLNLSSSPFIGYQQTHVMNHYSIVNYTFFNCSSTNNEILNKKTPIECLSVPGRYNIFAIRTYNYELEYEPLTYCTAGKTIPLPYDPDFDWRNGQTKFSWFSPKCGHCEKQRQRCRFKKKKSTGSPDDDHDNNDHDHYDTECFFIPKSHAKERLIERVVPALGILGLLIAATLIAKRRYDTFRFNKLERWIYGRLQEAEHLEIKVESEGDEKIAKKLSIVGLWCVQWYPVDRPSISGVVQMLEGETENLTIPPNPFASTTTPEKNTRNIQQRPRDHHALSIISEHDELE